MALTCVEPSDTPAAALIPEHVSVGSRGVVVRLVLRPILVVVERGVQLLPVHLRTPRVSVNLQEYLAHKKTPHPLGPLYSPRHSPSVGSQGEAVSCKRGMPAVVERRAELLPVHLRPTGLSVNFCKHQDFSQLTGVLHSQEIPRYSPTVGS